MKELKKDEYIKGILDGNKTILSQAITLIESEKASHQVLAQDILNEILPFTGNSERIGISGIPGVGKSTFIESFGTHLINENKRKIAVLAIDPSSQKTGGSILGDKTRMNQLSQSENAFIRPTPSSGHLGGVAKKTRETILLCEAAGFDTILVETVGVGQSEVIVSQMVDFFLLLLQPGAGDDLQGIKRGIMEVAHLVAVNKSDGDNLDKSQVARHDYELALHILHQKNQWQPKVINISALYSTGLKEVENIISDFFSSQSELIKKVRRTQEGQWLRTLLTEKFELELKQNEKIKKVVSEVEAQIYNNQVTAARGAQIIYESYKKYLN